MKTSDIALNSGTAYAYRKDQYSDVRQVFPLKIREKGRAKDGGGRYFGGGHGMDIIGCAVEVYQYGRDKLGYVPSWRFEWVNPKNITETWEDFLKVKEQAAINKKKNDAARKVRRRTNLAQLKALPDGLLKEVFGNDILVKDKHYGTVDHRLDRLLDGHKVSVNLGVAQLQALTTFFAALHSDETVEIDQLLSTFNKG